MHHYSSGIVRGYDYGIKKNLEDCGSNMFLILEMKSESVQLSIVGLGVDVALIRILSTKVVAGVGRSVFHIYCKTECIATYLELCDTKTMESTKF